MSSPKPGIFISVLGLLLMIAAPSVAAQGSTLSSIVPGAITVVGEGSASVPAETANVAITIGPDTNIYVEPLEMGPDAAAVPDSVDVSGVVDAMITHGVPVNDVEVLETPFMGEWGAGMTAQPVSILVTITNPTVEELSALLEVVRNAAHSDGLYLNQFGVIYGVSNCRDLRQQARVDAVANARLEAEDQAVALDTNLGRVVASRDTFPMNTGYVATNSCTNMSAPKAMSTVYMAGQFDPSLPAEVVVVVAVEISFEIP